MRQRFDGCWGRPMGVSSSSSFWLTAKVAACFVSGVGVGIVSVAYTEAQTEESGNGFVGVLRSCIISTSTYISHILVAVEPNDTCPSTRCPHGCGYTAEDGKVYFRWADTHSPCTLPKVPTLPTLGTYPPSLSTIPEIPTLLQYATLRPVITACSL